MTVSTAAVPSPASLPPTGLPRRRRDPGAPSRGATAFAALSVQVRESGLLERRHGYYWTKIVVMVVAMAMVWVAFAMVGNSWYQLVVAAALAVVCTQFAFLGHDAAHRQVFSSAAWNDWTSLLIGDLMIGICSGWWLSKHSRHHGAPNQEGKDPDIASGVLSFTPAATAGRGRIGAVLTARQGFYFFPLLLLEGLNLHVQGARTALGKGPVKHRSVEISLLSLRIVGYLTLLAVALPPGKAIAFLAVQLGVFGLYMGCSFAPNHTGMPIVPANLTVDFLRRQVLMSRNIRGGRWMTFVFGGLNYQIEHHLFPSMPRPNLRRARAIVRPFCQAQGITYTETGLFQAYVIVVRYLNQVGLKGRDPFQCPLVSIYRPTS